MKARERHDRRDWLIIFFLILLGFLCILLTSGWALRFAPNWRLETNMESRLDPNSNFLNSRPDGYFEPLDPSILTQPAWMNVFLTPGASFATRTPAPASTSVNTTPVPPTPTAKPPIISSPTNTLVVPTRTSISIPPTRTPTPGPTISTDLRITKSDGVATYIAGSPVTYTIVVSNNGPNNVNGARVTDTKPSQVTTWQWACTNQNNGASGCNPMSGNANFNDTVYLPVGGSITYTVNANIAVNATGNLVNTATVSVPPGYTDPNNANNSATDTDTFIPTVDLQVTKDDGVTTYIANGSNSYTIIITNNGPDDVVGATITDNIPTQITNWSWTCVETGGATGCDPATNTNVNFTDTVDLPDGASITYTVTADISNTPTGNLVNTASINVPVGYNDPVAGNDSDTDTDTYTPSADLAISKDDGAANYTPGGSVTYTITVTNNGPDAVTNAQVTDTFLAPITSANWTCSGAGGGTCTANGAGNISDSINLPVGASVTYSVTANTSSSATGNLSNTASVSTPVGITDPVAGNDSDTDIDTPAPSADLSITKTDNAPHYAANGTKTYTIVVSNTGPSDATGANNATVTDTFSANVASAIWTCSGTGGGTCTANSSGNISDTVNLPAGASVTYVVDVTIINTPSGDLVNTATVSSPISTPSSTTDTDTLIKADPPPGEVGTNPDGTVYNLGAGGSLTLDINLVANGDAGYDLVYYELPNGSGILLDWVIIEISDGNNWYTVFNWGNNVADTNTNVDFNILPNPQVPEEPDQRDIPSANLYNATGVAINIDIAGVPTGTTYSFIRITAPMGDIDGMLEIDAIEVLP